MNKFQLNDTVMTKRIGLPGVGTVVGVNNAEIHKSLIGAQKSAWSNLYPQWEQQPVYILEFEQPRHTETFEEYCAAMCDIYQNIHDVDKNDLKIMYKYSLKSRYIAYPEDDLEKF